MPDLANITQERAARRFAQIAQLERHLSLAMADIAQAKAHVKELEKEADGLLTRIRTAARDDGELPLFDLTEDVHADLSR
jgi:hypothetical protein